MGLKTYLACDADLTKLDRLPYPMMVSAKIDGVRGRVIDGKLVGRSMKAIPNRHTAHWVGKLGAALEGLDFEMTAGSDAAAPDLCRATTSAVMSIEGMPDIHLWVFDCSRKDEEYYHRWLRASAVVDLIKRQHPQYAHRLHIAPWANAESPEELLEYEQHCLDAGYEGVIIRSPAGKYKEGRSTVKEAGYLRIKRFVEEEAEVLELEEAMENTNEAKENELGHKERSSHQAGMVPKGMLGALICRDLKTGQTIKVGPGKLTHDERKHYWDNPSELVKLTIKYKCFPVGVKDKPRFPTFVCVRPPEDMV